MHIAQVALLVRDYDEAIRWFVAALGFRLVEDRPLGAGKRWVLIAPPGPGTARLLLARAATPDQVAAVGKQAGGRVFEPPRDEAYGIVAVFEDLYGNKWDLIEPKSA